MKKLQDFTVTKEELREKLGFTTRIFESLDDIITLKGIELEECPPHDMRLYSGEDGDWERCTKCEKTGKEIGEGNRVHASNPKPQEEECQCAGRTLPREDMWHTKSCVISATIKHSKDKPQPIEKMEIPSQGIEFVNKENTYKILHKLNEHTKAINKINNAQSNKNIT